MSQDRRFPPPKYNPLVEKLARLFGRLYLRFALGIDVLTMLDEAVLKAETEAFRTGKQNLIIAFRHTAKEDAPALLLGSKGQHLRFLYGRDVLNWAGRSTRFLFPRLGFVAIQNRHSNTNGMRLLRKEMQNGRFPIALAPEGQVTYHMFQTDVLQSGVANLAEWALQTKQEATILPIAIAYRYPEPLTSLLHAWEQKSGMTLQGEHPLDQACWSTLDVVASHFHLECRTHGSYAEKRDDLCAQLLRLGEHEAGLEDHEGSILDRLFRLRFAGEDALFTEHPDRGKQQSALQYLQYAQTVDVLEYINPSYLLAGNREIREKEVVLNLLDVLNRLDGGSINTRYSPKHKQAFLLAGEPIRLRTIVRPELSRKERIQFIQQQVALGLQETSEALESRM
ncbi:hypothetical protein [Sphaerochaeta sp.]|uniref:hypothetical protein n=1 Tax=Sphaerochaeta sp. TaxID=1972642 RepID=UPI002FC76314